MGTDSGAGIYDVVVAGGGPAGCAAALTLARAGRTVLLADAGTGPPKLGETLVPAGRLLLGDLGVADLPVAGLGVADTGVAERVPGRGHLPCYGNLSAWGSAELHAVDFVNDPHGHGWHLERPLFDRQLRDASRAAGAEVAEGTAVRDAVRHAVRRSAPGGWSLSLRAARTVPGSGTAERAVRCRWLIDATGRAARIAVRAGARRRIHDRLTAVHTILEANSRDTDRRSLVESDENGWWYTALQPSGGRLVAYFTDADLPAAAHTARHFGRRMLATRHVSRSVRPHEQSIPSAAPPRRVAAHTAELDRIYGDGWIAAGDAAVAFDPLSSQGVLTALYTGLSAGEAVDACLNRTGSGPSRMDIGEEAVLADYARKVSETRTAYLRGHRVVHAQESRWPHRTFWARRHAHLTDPLLHSRPPETPLPTAGKDQFP
ncbi:NAD(P)/FAD-dependent oxidoreductase [Streptomyces marispadix]|uniref:Tryptophan 7-halogenase n=1 Tax=Streptomyces marispadix TaxID=2922868 RepID=A0ABS9T423_9ACTN|nr:tryptophan 7-halogenase [Streptomyces marispadix]MCH6163275.1 tryptophan 7-halogenase [Streptomyces marispadix]